MSAYAWEIVGCIVVLAMLGIGALIFGSWLDDQGEPEEWWGNEE